MMVTCANRAADIRLERLNAAKRTLQVTAVYVTVERIARPIRILCKDRSSRRQDSGALSSPRMRTQLARQDGSGAS